MKVYFIFDIKEELKKLYLGKEKELYQLLRSIYYLRDNQVEYGYELLRQIINPINKEVIDRDIFVKLHRDYPYSKKNNIHYYNELYTDEVSRLYVKRCYIKLEVDNSTSSFFNILKVFSNNYFACDFASLRYFFLVENTCKS